MLDDKFECLPRGTIKRLKRLEKIEDAAINLMKAETMAEDAEGWILLEEALKE